MNQQNTIFMAIEQQQEQQIKSITNFSCVYCNQSRYKSGFFTILREGGIQLFCSKECADYQKKRKQTLICVHCGESFDNSSTGGYRRKYCSDKCNLAAHYNKYKKFNWCDMCNEWISKYDSVFKPAGTIVYHNKNRYKLKKDNQFCPNCKNRLRVRKWAKKQKK